MGKNRREQIADLELDVDLRMQELWKELLNVKKQKFENDDDFLAIVSSFMRAAYGMGYVAALYEDVRGERGKLAREHGYRYPK